MKKIIINDNQIGLLFRRGHFVKPLGAGKYRIHGDTGIEVLPRYLCTRFDVGPGEIREIMNTVLVARKRAQANVITRREEVASTRSLLNTAKLMEENQTLYKLKELEFVERICENVGSIHLSGSGDILGQLTALLQSGRE